MTYTDHDKDILARTIFGEAEVGDVDDATAIANVVMNRARYPNWPDSPARVCQQPWQFSCWNAGDPQRPRIEAVTADTPWFRECRRIAAAALDGTLGDQTGGATHYWATYIPEPKWARGKVPCYVNDYGRYSHRFYNDIDTPPPQTAAQALDQARPLSATRTVKGAQVALGGGVTLAGAVEYAQQLRGVLPLVDQLRSYSHWVVLAIAAAGIAYMVWARLDDRAKGMR